MSSEEETPDRVYLLTLGCPKNDADSRSIRRSLIEAGASVVDDPATATHIVVNTCGFIRDAKEESIDTILGVCEEWPDKKILAMGCLVERYRDELARGIPEVSGWFGLASTATSEQLLSMLSQSGNRRLPDRTNEAGRAGSYAYVKISDGCDEGCTFCAIPGIKGPYVSAGLDDILGEADSCLTEGARELVLVGQDTTRWSDGDVGLMGLIDALASDDRVRRIRVMYLQPTRLDDRFLEFMAGHRKLCRYLDVPFQHSHRAVLRRMARRGDGDMYSDLVRRARDLMPTVSTRSTFIVGFPGETARHFEHLLGFVESVEFDYGGAFVYSPEEDTSAEKLRPRVSRTVAMRRLERLNEVLLRVGEIRREKLLGTEVDVMVDSSYAEEGIEGALAIARTEGQAPEVDGVTYITGSSSVTLSPGDMARVKVTDVLGCDLVGEISAP